MLRLLVVMIALVAGAGAGWLALTATWREPAEPVTIFVEEERTEVLAANLDLLRGATLQHEHLTWTSWPAAQVSPGMILREEKPDARDELAGRVLRSNLYAAEPVRMQHLSTGVGGFLSTVLQPGQRGIGLLISEEKTAGGFILPNDRVDVLHTVVRDFNGDGRQTGSTRTILTNVRVLAIGQTTLESSTLVVDETTRSSAQATGANGQNLTGRTATLEATPDQAEILLAAAASGQLALVLRAADDFGLSEIGDLSLIEERASPESSAATADAGSGADASTPLQSRQREVTIISAGIPQTILTSVKEER